MKKILIIGLIALLTTGCSQAKEQVESQTNTNSIVADSLGDTFYAPIKRETNQDRNVFYPTYGGTKDFITIGRDLEKLSSSHFSTDGHYMAEGQYLEGEFREQLFNRTNKEKSVKEYPNSIQPDRGREIDGVTNPIMVNEIYEQDFYTDDKGEKLAGVSFALVLDPADEKGSQLVTPMKDETLRSYGEEIIPKFYNYITTDKKLKKIYGEIPIYICVYQAANKIDSYVNGRYILDCYSEGSQGSINKLSFNNLLITSAEAINLDSTTPTEFETLKTELKKLSVDAVNVIGYGKYDGKTLQYLEIEVTVNVKSYGELEFFVSKAADVLNSAFSEIFDIKMSIKTHDNIEATIIKNRGQDAEVIPLFY